MLEPDVAVKIDFCRHDCLAGQIDTGCSSRNLDVALATDARESSVLDDERGVLDRRAAVAGNEPRPFEDRRTGPLSALCFHPGGARRHAHCQQYRDDLQEV